jgi:hypothetical protein
MKDKYIVIPVEELRADQPRWFLHAKATNFDPRSMHAMTWDKLSLLDSALQKLSAPTHCIVKDESPQQWMLPDKAKDFIEDQLLKMEDEIREQIKYMDVDEPLSPLLNKAQEIDELRKVFGLPEKIRKVVKREQMSFVDSLYVSKEG